MQSVTAILKDTGILNQLSNKWLKCIGCPRTFARLQHQRAQLPEMAVSAIFGQLVAPVYITGTI